MNYLGEHILAEFFDCCPDTLADLESIETVMLEAADAAHTTIIDHAFHRFEPVGVSGFVLIKESHLSIHTWPEYGYAAVDLFTCGKDVTPWAAFDVLNDRLEARKKIILELKRGVSLTQKHEPFVLR